MVREMFTASLRLHVGNKLGAGRPGGGGCCRGAVGGGWWWTGPGWSHGGPEVAGPGSPLKVQATGFAVGLDMGVRAEAGSRVIPRLLWGS